MSLQLERLTATVRSKAAPFLEDAARIAGPSLHSLHLVGSCVTPDWVAGRSDINSLLVLREMNLGVLETIAPLGRRYKGSGVAPPVVLDQAYVQTSLDVFPMEFLELRLIHETVAGEDILAGIEIDHADLRRQCEREIKSRLVGLRQGYLRSLGEPKALTAALVGLLAGYQSLVRGILVLHGQKPPLRRVETFAALSTVAGPEADVFTEVLAVREGRSKPDAAGVRQLFERCHKVTEHLGRILDDL